MARQQRFWIMTYQKGGQIEGYTVVHTNHAMTAAPWYGLVDQTYPHMGSSYDANGNMRPGWRTVKDILAGDELLWHRVAWVGYFRW